MTGQNVIWFNGQSIWREVISCFSFPINKSFFMVVFASLILFSTPPPSSNVKAAIEFIHSQSFL